jgi:hypothetical protein
MRAAGPVGARRRAGQVARQIGVSYQIVSDWRDAWRRRGRDSLRRAGRAVRLPKVSRGQLEQVEVGGPKVPSMLPRRTDAIGVGARVRGGGVPAGTVWTVRFCLASLCCLLHLGIRFEGRRPNCHGSGVVG